MMHFQYDIACCILFLSFALKPISGNLQDVRRLQHRAAHLPDAKFSLTDYAEYTDNDDRDGGSLGLQWNQLPHQLNHERLTKIPSNTASRLSEVLDKNIVWDLHWAHNLKFGQISAVSIDPNGNIAVFHRGSRVWDTNTFDVSNKFDPSNGPIRENTIVLLDKSGRKLLQWGKDMFYLPHGLTVDSFGNYWITDVALHQVFKFDAKDIERHMDELKKEQFNRKTPLYEYQDTNNLFEHSILKPSLILGEAFQPGNDEIRFCKPTAVAVQKDGDFFVSDGYCNSRVIKFNSKGERILTLGRHWGMGGRYGAPLPQYALNVPHALSLASELNLIFVADRENGRALSFFTTNGTFHQEYKHPLIGPEVYSVAYAKEKLYLINGLDESMNNDEVHVRGFVLDIYTGKILSEFGPGQDMRRPHDIAVTDNGSEIYVVELDKHMIYRFVQDVNASTQTDASMKHANPHHETAPLTDNNSSNSSNGGTTTTTLVLSLVTAAVVFIALCVAIAALVARCQKRGCLLTVRKKMRWETERREIFKLSSFLENRRGKGFKVLEKRPNPRDFSKLNTEPETSEDEHTENSLTKII